METNIIPGIGFQGFICEMSGEPVPAEICLACAEAGAPGCKMGSPAIIAGIIRNMRPAGFSLEHAQDGCETALDFGFSATELLGCARKKRLTQEHPWYDRPSNLYWAFRGSIMHAEAEKYARDNPYALVEERLTWRLRHKGQAIGLSGAPDLIIYQPHQKGWVLMDYKTISEVNEYVWRHICKATDKVITDMPFPVNGKGINCRHCDEKHPKEDVTIVKVEFSPRGTHVEQLQLYALLIEKLEGKSGVLSAAVNAKLAAVGITDPGMLVPQAAPVVGAELIYLDMKRVLRREVEIWPADDRLTFLKERLATATTPDLPPVLTDANDLWQCNYCPVASLCKELAEKAE